MLPKLTFVLGGAASGKSVWAEDLLINSGLNPVYLATSRVLDDEIGHRVKLHRSRRSVRWVNLEADLDLAPALAGLSADQGVLIDCATMWLSNHLLDGNDLEEAQTGLLRALANGKAPAIIVSNEVGQGIVPDNALARRFREAQGRLNIALAEQADLVVNVIAGLPMLLKGTLP